MNTGTENGMEMLIKHIVYPNLIKNLNHSLRSQFSQLWPSFKFVGLKYREVYWKGNIQCKFTKCYLPRPFQFQFHTVYLMMLIEVSFLQQISVMWKLRHKNPMAFICRMFQISVLSNKRHSCHLCVIHYWDPAHTHCPVLLEFRLNILSETYPFI